MNVSHRAASHAAFRDWARRLVAHHNATSTKADDGRDVYQTSTIAALLEGVYDGDVTIAELLGHGDFGLGTFNHLDGEMLILDGVCYHLHADGSVNTAADDDLTPFAAVMRFQADKRVPVDAPCDRAALTRLIDEATASRNLLYAVRVTGDFSTMHTRTVMEQKRPYPPFGEAAAGQKETVLHDVRGTLAGFRTPAYEQGVSVAGYHLHFIDEQRRSGGHALDFHMRRGTVEISATSELHLSLPRTDEFLKAAQLSQAEVDSQIHRTE